MACIYCNDTGTFDDLSDPYAIVQVYCFCPAGQVLTDTLSVIADQIEVGALELPPEDKAGRYWELLAKNAKR